MFLPCSFWLAICLNLLWAQRRSARTFERLLTLQNDLGLLSEEYDPRDKRLLGNFPQAFTHVSSSSLLSFGRDGITTIRR